MYTQAAKNPKILCIAISVILDKFQFITVHNRSRNTLILVDQTPSRWCEHGINYFFMKRIAVFPGSFDPVTLGHIHIVQKASSLFDVVYLAIGVNTNKICMFELSQRLQWLAIAAQRIENVEVISYSGLTTDFCKKVNARFIIRGIRNSVDLEYEKAISETNFIIEPEIQTVFLLSDPTMTFIQSGILRELIRNKSDVSMFLPGGVNVYE